MTTTPARPTRALRFVALGGFLALVASLVLTAIVALNDAIAGDGRSGPATSAAFWAVGVGAAVGFLAMVLPRAAIEHRVRSGAVVLQYALAVMAPVIALMD